MNRRKLYNQGELYLYVEISEAGGVRLIRCYGVSPSVVLPKEIAGKALTEIGEYSFADSPRAPQRPDGLPEYVRELAGEYVREIRLPGSVVQIGSLAFYNCRGLKRLSFGSALTKIGSDIFMNCRSLKDLRVNCHVGDSTGLKQLLAQKMTDVEVTFERNGECQARLFYPEYSQVYDEIGPAHIFAMNIQGEGFRFRQCFREGIICFRDYDAVFEQACTGETVATLCRLVADRLAYPVELEEEAAHRYTSFVQEHQEELTGFLVENENIEMIRIFADKKILSGSGLQTAAAMASARKWIPGTAAIMRLQQEQNETGKPDGRYDFEEW